MQPRAPLCALLSPSGGRAGLRPFRLVGGRLGSVFPVAFTDRGESLGEACPVCLDYLNRRKGDAEDPTLGNWPARDWPTLEDLEEARGRHPEPMFPDSAAYEAVVTPFEGEEEVAEASTV